MADQPPKETNREGVRTLVRRGGQLVDVLPRAEYERSHLAGAISLPMAYIDRTAANRLKWDRPVIVYGQDNQDDRSGRAAWRLASMGFTQVYRYTAGKADWLANGLPAEGSEGRAAGAGDLADMEVPTCKISEKLEAVRQRVQKEGWDTCVVVNDEEIVLGLLRKIAFDKADPHWIAEEAMERDPQTYRLNTPLEQVTADLQANLNLESFLVTTSDGKLFGLVRRRDVEKK